MSRYIDADWLYEKVENRYRLSSGIEHRCERDLLDLICDAPTADVIEVRHSKIKWVNRPIPAQCATVVDEYGKEHYGMIHGLIKNNPVGYCEECGKRLDDTFMNFCPNCGAKMDGERREE